MPKIAIMYANTGGGHLSAARAIEAAVHLRYPGQYRVSVMNIPLASGSQRVRMLYESYNLMLKADPRYAKHGLKLLNAFNVEKAVIPWLRRAYLNVRRVLDQEKPDIVVSVHAIVNHSVIRALKDLGRFGDVPYVIVCTDLTNNYLKGWANPEATRAITFTEMAKRQMIAYGMPSEQVRVIEGFPVNPSFFQTPASKEECRTAFGLRPELFTVLISLGGVAIPRKTSAVVRALINSGLPVQLMVICGMNRSLKRKMHHIARRTPVRMQVYGFTQRIGQMMTAADLMISKPGPGTIMEAVVKELPLVLDGVTEPMPQEVGNLAYASKQGVAITMRSYRELPAIVQRLMTDRAQYEYLQRNMRAMKHEEAIFEVVDAILDELPVRLTAVSS